MALTATAQSALPREPAWDEVIVPALRKRLKDESNVLAKRISAASITSLEEQAAQYYAAQRPGTSTSSYSNSSKPSAIPRPSLQSTRTVDSSSGAYAGARPTQYSRARALSQPYPVELPPSTDHAPPFSETRPISPINAPKGTRIPVSRTRTGSTSSQAQPMFNGSLSAGRVNGYTKHSGEASESQLWPVEEKVHQSPAQSQTSRSTIQVPRRKISDIFQEQAPFAPQSISSSHSQLDYTPERLSSDSEEHPFEHWYRGDVARNGGVGELRVARRQEMLDIANYGHSLRLPLSKAHSGLSSRSRSNSRGRDMPNGRVRVRQRSGSMGARESIYIDDEGVAEGDAVLDEKPLTDLDDDGYDDDLDDYYAQAVQPHPNGSISSPSFDIRSDTPTSRQAQNSTRSRIPQPTSRSRTTTPTPAPAKPTRSASESGMTSPSSPTFSPAVPRSASQPLKTQGLSSSTTGSLSTPSTPTTKRRAKSPAATPQSSAKKQKAKAPPSSMQKRSVARHEENRRSIGQYPLPDGGEDAIPTWTQPRPANGNWDDVVLPAVAKKKGLQDQYETADGTPKPKEPEPVVFEPAPGTFGYDPTKNRKRWSKHPELISMDEFGQPTIQSPQDVPEHGPDEHLMPETQTIPTTPRSADRSRIESPPPFAHYLAGGQDTLPPIQMQMEVLRQASPLASKEQHLPHPADEEDSGGCCKCIIM